MTPKDGVSARFAEEVVPPPPKAPPFPELPLDSLHPDAERNAFFSWNEPLQSAQCIFYKLGRMPPGSCRDRQGQENCIKCHLVRDGGY